MKGVKEPCKEEVRMSEVGNERGDGAVKGRGGEGRGWHCDGEASHIFKINLFHLQVTRKKQSYKKQSHKKRKGRNKKQETRNKVRRNIKGETRIKVVMLKSC